MDAFKPPVPTRFPSILLLRAQAEELLPEIIRHQEAFAHIMWEAYQSLGYRLDELYERIEEIQKRLFRLERDYPELCVRG